MNYKLKASYTIEAVYVMALVLWSVMSLIKYGINLHNQVIGSMLLSEKIEEIQSSELRTDKFILYENKIKGVLSQKDFVLQIILSGDFEEGYTMKGMIKTTGWEKEIIKNRFQPENFIRKTAATEMED